MQRRFILLVTVFAFVLGFAAVQTTPSHAASTKVTASVHTYRLIVRAAANAKAAKVVVLNEGEMVTVIGHDAKGNWVKIQTSKGVIGWTRAAFLKVVTGTIKSLPVAA